MFPFSFCHTSQERVKQNISFDDEEDTVSFHQYQYYTFNAEESAENVSESDKITFLNIPFLVSFMLANSFLLLNIIICVFWQTMLQTTESIPSSFPLDVATALPQIFETPSLFFEGTVKDIIFDGVKFCDPSRLESLSAKILCLAILVMNLRNLEYLEDGSAKFSLFHYVSFFFLVSDYFKLLANG